MAVDLAGQGLARFVARNGKAFLEGRLIMCSDCDERRNIETLLALMS
jgi:hypothetical protein